MAMAQNDDLLNLVCQEGTDLSVPSCARDGGRPPGAGFQEQAPNHLKLRWSKVIVVSVEEKGEAKPRQV